jgi:hypothetical protein
LVIPVRVIPEPQEAQTAMPVSSEGPFTTRGRGLGIAPREFRLHALEIALLDQDGTGMWITVDGSCLLPSRELRTP